MRWLCDVLIWGFKYHVVLSASQNDTLELAMSIEDLGEESNDGKVPLK